MRRCRKAEASGSVASHGSIPEELRPFLDVLTEMLAEAFLRDPGQLQPAREADTPSLKDDGVGLESAPDSPEASEEV
jgi:hypothetical protein